jgi:prophage regulatory protein
MGAKEYQHMAASMLRLPDVLARRGKKRTSHYMDVKNGLFTRPVRIGVRQGAWPDHEVDALNRARIAGKSDQDIRLLVKLLEAARSKK